MIIYDSFTVRLDGSKIDVVTLDDNTFVMSINEDVEQRAGECITFTKDEMHQFVNKLLDITESRDE